MNFPHAEQVFTIERKTKLLSKGQSREEVVCGVTSLTSEKADAARLLELNRGHWQIENRVHYVRDVTFDEDRSQVRNRSGAHMMASIRNLVISIFRLLGFRYIPDAIRYFAMRIEKAFNLIGI